MKLPTGEPYALITGVCGGIGSALAHAFSEAGYRVIGTDVAPRPDQLRVDHFLSADLAVLADSTAATEEFAGLVRDIVSDGQLAVLVNNAAVQIVKPLTDLSQEEFVKTLAVNVVLPFVLVRALLPELAKAGGSIVNISSIHASLSKPGFVAYATSKAALSGLTRALGVEIGAQVRVNAIAPAAIETPLLQAGFSGRKHDYDSLAGMHPVGRIGRPGEVADLAVFLASERAQFINGAVFEIDGGIGSRLHDPA